ncbi:MAG: nuclear transport factor 2 family protein [Pirellulales bacterium]
MTAEHPNISLLKRLDLRNLEAAKGLIAEDVIWHYFNPNLPELQGDYVGMDGIRSFFQRVGEISRGTFKIEPVSITPVGDELVMVQVRDTLTIDGKSHARDVVVVWRIVDGRVVEVWDIVPGQPAESSDARH